MGIALSRTGRYLPFAIGDTMIQDRASVILSWFRSKANLRRFLSEAGQLVARNIVLLVVGLATTPVMTLVFSREQFGVYQFTHGVVGSLAFLTLHGLKQVIVQETAKGRHGTLARALQLRVRASVLEVVVLLCLAGYYYVVAEQRTLALCFMATSLLFPIGAVLDSYESYLLGRKSYTLYSRLPMMVGIGVSLATVLSAWLLRNPAAALLAYGAGQVGLRIVAHRVALKYEPPIGSEWSAPALRFGVGLSAVGLMPMVSLRLGTVLVGALFSMPEVSVLALALMLLEKSKTLLNVLGEVFGPRVVSQSGADLFRRANWAILAYVAIVLCYTLVIVAATPVIFRVLFPLYLDVIPLARLAVLSLLPGAPAAIMELTITSEERLKQTSVIRSVQFGFDLVTIFAAVQLWGVTGVIIAKFLSGTLRTIVTFVFYLRNRREATGRDQCT